MLEEWLGVLDRRDDDEIQLTRALPIESEEVYFRQS